MFDRPPYRTAAVFRGCYGKLFALAVIAGCNAEASAPAALESSEREAIKRNLTSVGARVTSDTADGLYFALRNTYVDIRSGGGTVEGAYKTQQDVTDFAKASTAIAKVFLAGADNEQFAKWLRTSMSGRSRGPQQADYKRLKLTLSRVPLHLVFSLNRETEMK
jgi:hypothetical protein